MPLDAQAPKRMARSAAEVVSAHAASQSRAEDQATPLTSIFKPLSRH
jgi:hypothetical protein